MIDMFCSKHFLMKMLLYLDSENKSFIVGSRKLQLPQLTEGTASTVLWMKRSFTNKTYLLKKSTEILNPLWAGM